MRSFFLIVVLLLIKQEASFSQDVFDKVYNDRVSLKIGYLGIRMRDRVISSYLYSGNAVPMNLSYENTGPEMRMFVSITMPVGVVTKLHTKALENFKYTGDRGSEVDDKIGDLTHSDVNLRYLDFDFGIMWRLHHVKNEKIKMYLGGKLDYLLMNKKFLSLWYTNSLKDKYLSFCIAGLWEYNISGRHRLRAGLSIPVISSINRSLTLEGGDPFFVEYKKWASFNNFFSLSTSLSYGFMLTPRWGLEADYRFNYLQCSFPRKQQTGMQSLMAGVNFNF